MATVLEGFNIYWLPNGGWAAYRVGDDPPIVGLGMTQMLAVADWHRQRAELNKTPANGTD